MPIALFVVQEGNVTGTIVVDRDTILINSDGDDYLRKYIYAVFTVLFQYLGNHDE
jgi:hypothetical protein